MAENACACCGSTEEQPATDTEQSDTSGERSATGETGRWIGDADGLDATLPADVQAALGQFFPRMGERRVSSDRRAAAGRCNRVRERAD